MRGRPRHRPPGRHRPPTRRSATAPATGRWAATHRDGHARPATTSRGGPTRRAARRPAAGRSAAGRPWAPMGGRPRPRPRRSGPPGGPPRPGRPVRSMGRPDPTSRPATASLMAAGRPRTGAPPPPAGHHAPGRRRPPDAPPDAPPGDRPLGGHGRPCAADRAPGREDPGRRADHRDRIDPSGPLDGPIRRAARRPRRSWPLGGQASGRHHARTTTTPRGAATPGRPPRPAHPRTTATDHGFDTGARPAASSGAEDLATEG